MRKHLEIPAAGAVLIAPDSAALKPYGFRDMENCILGSGLDLFEKIAVVADNPDLYEKIRKNGYDLVHAKYSRQNWRGILDFYECLRGLKAGEIPQQQGIFGTFKAVPAPRLPMPAITEAYPDNDIAALAKLWIQSLVAGTDFTDVQAKMAENAALLSHMSEHWIPLGIAALLKGNTDYAKECFLRPQHLRQADTGFTDYDPEEIAWLSLTAALTNDADLLGLTRQNSAMMRHLSLRRIQWLGNALASGGDLSNPPDDILHSKANDSLSVHWTGQLPAQDWLSIIQRILKAHGQ